MLWLNGTASIFAVRSKPKTENWPSVAAFNADLARAIYQHSTLMRDPAGLPFCVVPDPPGTLTDANAQRWD